MFEPTWRWVKLADEPGWSKAVKNKPALYAQEIDFLPTGFPDIDHMIVEAIWLTARSSRVALTFELSSYDMYTRLREILPKAQAFELK